MSALKRPFYILCSVVLGILLGLLLHAGVELLVISALTASQDPNPLGISWSQWFGLHSIWTVVTFTGGAAGGYALGIRWWQWVYVEKRHWRVRKAESLPPLPDSSSSMPSALKDFVQFIREQGVVGLAIGFVMGGATSKVVASFVTDIIQPIIGLIFGSAKGLATMQIGPVKYGSFLTNMIDFAILAAVVFFVFKGLKLDRLDHKKDAA